MISLALYAYILLLVGVHGSACPPGLYKQDPTAPPSSCIPCEVGKHSTANGTSCDLCSQGSYQPLEGQTGCLACPAGKMQHEEGKSNCWDCWAGSYQDGIASTWCKHCATGLYQPFTGQTSCLQCPTGKFQHEVGKNYCHNCWAGSYQDGNGSAWCKQCAIGKFSDVTGRASPCEACQIGKYTHVNGSVACFDCPAGKATWQVGSPICSTLNCPAGTKQIGINNCVVCPLGRYSEYGKQYCKWCSPGSFANVTGTPNSCLNSTCAPGSHANSIMNDTCTKCTKGKSTNNVTGATTCSTCKLGTYADSEGAAFCTKSTCQPGKVANSVQADTCEACPPGKIASQIGSVNCTGCYTWSYFLNKVMEPCPFSWCAREFTITKQTETTYILNYVDNNNRYPEPIPRQSTLALAEGGASLYTTGNPHEVYTFTIEEQSLLCHRFTHGMWTPIGTISVRDPERMYINSQQTGCDIGFCPAGKYQTSLTDPALCKECDFGKYQDKAAQTFCKDVFCSSESEHGSWSKLRDNDTNILWRTRGECVKCPPFFGHSGESKYNTACRDNRWAIAFIPFVFGGFLWVVYSHRRSMIYQERHGKKPPCCYHFGQIPEPELSIVYPSQNVEKKIKPDNLLHMNSMTYKLSKLVNTDKKEELLQRIQRLLITYADTNNMIEMQKKLREGDQETVTLWSQFIGKRFWSFKTGKEPKPFGENFIFDKIEGGFVTVSPKEGRTEYIVVNGKLQRKDNPQLTCELVGNDFVWSHGYTSRMTKKQPDLDPWRKFVGKKLCSFKNGTGPHQSVETFTFEKTNDGYATVGTKSGRNEYHLINNGQKLQHAVHKNKVTCTLNGEDFNWSHGYTSRIV